MEPITIGLFVIAVVAGGAAFGFFAMWRHSEELQRGFRRDAQRYRIERDEVEGLCADAMAQIKTLRAAAADRHDKLSKAGKKGRAVQLAKRRAA